MSSSIAIWRFATTVIIATASIQLLDVAWGIIGASHALAHSSHRFLHALLKPPRSQASHG